MPRIEVSLIFMARDPATTMVLAAAGILAGMYFTSDSSVNRPAPAFDLPEAYGGHVRLESYRGHPVLLAFWMTSCGVCRRELPLLSRMAPELQGKGVEVLAIHLGSGGDEARDYLSANHIHLKSVSDPEGSVAQAYRVSGVPKLVLVGSDGVIRRTQLGGATSHTLRTWADSVATR
jgi:peroxiredoxin